MRQTLKAYREGYLRVRLNGFSPERFLNLCMNNQVDIWDLRWQEGGYRFFITLKDFRRVRPLVHKSHVRLRIEGRFGLPFFLYRNRRRKLYAAGACCFFLVLIVMSQFIWNISLEGNYRFTDDMLLHYLDSMDIRYGTASRGIDCDALEESIRSRYPEILWVSARISGTRLMIRVKENDVIGTVPEKDESPRDLVAEKAGRITKIMVRRGKAQVDVGDEVEPGQVLVSGTVPIYNDSEELVNRQLVRADADILAVTGWSYREDIDRFTVQRSYSGHVRRGLRLRIGKAVFLWMMPAFGDTSWEITQENHQAAVLKDFYLPVWYDLVTAREYETYERVLTEGELEQKKEQINQKNMQNFLEKDIQILGNDVKILDKNGRWEVQGEFVLEEPIGTGQNIRETEETRQPDERGGDND